MLPNSCGRIPLSAHPGVSFYVSSVACPQNINIHQCDRQRKLIIISQRHGRSTGIAASLRWFQVWVWFQNGYITSSQHCTRLESRGVSIQITYKDKTNTHPSSISLFNPCTSCHSLCSNFCFNSSITTLLNPLFMFPMRVKCVGFPHVWLCRHGNRNGIVMCVLNFSPLSPQWGKPDTIPFPHL